MKVTLAVVLIGLAVFLACLKVECETCKGTGKSEQRQTRTVPCPQCSGKGNSAKLKAPSGAKISLGGDKRSCLKCKGKGTVTEELPAGDCLVCSGKGKVRLYEKWTR